MIKNFETLTAELSAEEKKACKYLYLILKDQKGPANALTNTIISERLNRAGVYAKGSKLRKMIHVAVVSGVLQGLCASQRGYYIAASMQDLFDYYESLADRISHIQARLKAVARDIKKAKAYSHKMKHVPKQAELKAEAEAYSARPSVKYLDDSQISLFEKPTNPENL